VSIEDVLKEITKMRRELRELKIQRDRDQRVIEELRRIVEKRSTGRFAVDASARRGCAERCPPSPASHARRRVAAIRSSRQR